MSPLPPPPSPPVLLPLYRDFYYPLNAFMHILTHEEGSVAYLHYGFFESEHDTIAEAQERSTAMLLERLPAPPARLLDVGVGVGTTLARLQSLGYDVLGITPDEKQVAVVRERHGVSAPVQCVRFEDVEAPIELDAIIFQESSQYIDSDALFARAAALTRHVIVLDEFALQPLDTPGALHSLSTFLAAAKRHGFEKSEELDMSRQAAPSTEYFMQRFERYRDALIRDLGITSQQVDELIAGGHRYQALYRDGVYGYRVLQFVRD